ncbi:MAG: DUF4424 family protein [Candidatus Andeanibacterium colombiense]|uniref:DUF4424 family protein n=1 Tax=Candidatus Andeanibacterium colombiense TaxID=3121345 RepID=A0AAJ6BNN1_9SPHN|nr:MAG: DUF4424 family protein [Sphingomonadaceae bacterium]
MLPLLAALAAALLPAPALANDSEAEWALGGLVLKQNDAISMDREDLFISAAEVKVDYTYTNHSDADQKVLVSFPMPALPGGAFAEPGAYPDFTGLDFATTVDGKAVGWTRTQRAVAGGRDVTDALEAEGFPLQWYQDDGFIEKISSLPANEGRRLERAGLLRRETDWGGNDLRPAWQVETSIVREQLFPARATIHVSHRYTPATGGSVGGLIEHLGEKDHAAQAAAYRQRYCTDAAFFAGFRKRQKAEAAKGGGDWSPGYGETWIGYVLSSGANWRGPIGEFRLVVDKGLPENLVSFCMDGVTKLSPTQFEVRKLDYEPDRDLNILILQWSSDDT